MKTLVIGANGQIGRQFCALAHTTGVPIRAMLRKPAQRDEFEAHGIEAVVADLEGDFGHAFDGCDQVLFTAGSGPHTGADKTLLIDLYGAIRAIDLAHARRLSRFVMVSALRAEDPQAAPPALRPYLAAKFAADAYLRTAGVPYVILKPGRLSDAPASRHVATSLDEPGAAETVSRGNVARALLHLVHARDLVYREFRLLDGAREISEALA